MVCNLKSLLSIVRLRDEFERDAEKFLASHAARDAAIGEQISRAKTLLPSVSVPDDALRTISQLCINLGTDGLRGELTLLRACRAFTALSGDQEVDMSHIHRVAAMSLRHRLRRDPLDDSGSTVRVERAMDAVGLAAA